jgi:hypothetical protein
LLLTPAQKVIIEGAFLSVEQEINLILNSLSRFEVFIDSEGLVTHLLSLKPQATDLIVARLQDANAHPERYRKVSVQSFGLLFRIAAQVDDPRVLPLLKEFQADPKPWLGLRRQAQIAEELIRTRATFSSTGTVESPKSVAHYE